jgi:membrane protein
MGDGVPAEGETARGRAGLVASWAAVAARTAALWQTLQHWPWLATMATLRQRFREDRLGVTASSLTFTTLISLVPLVTVMLALFAAFPMFSAFEVSLQKYFLQNLVPDAIARPVMQALTQFASKANRLGAVGLVFLVVSALALMLTIDRALNAIWRVQRPRPIGQRVLVWWAAVTLGPLALGISLSLTTAVLSASRSVTSVLPGGVELLLNALEFVLLAAAMAGLFHYVPNTQVRWRHAAAGGVFVSAGFEVAKKALAWYIGQVANFTLVYGAFATVPIFLVWIYLGWVIVLLGAVVAAYAPSLAMRVVRWREGPGARFELALALLRELKVARDGGTPGLEPLAIAHALRCDPLQVDSVLDVLGAIDWVGRLDEDDPARCVLIVEPSRTLVGPLAERLLVQRVDGTRALWQHAKLDELKLDALL